MNSLGPAKRYIIGIFAAILGGAWLVATAGETLAGGRVALVMGNSAYQATTELPNPQRDAAAIAVALEGLGFEVILSIDADRRASIRAIDDFSQLSAGADLAIFFFAGHGVQIGGRNFLLPTDVVADSERALRYSSIDAQEVIAEMERNANVSIAILDACRDNPLVDLVTRSAGRTRSASVARGLGRMRLSGRGALVAFAAAAGDTAADGTGEHSPYTAALLQEIAQPNVEIGLMFRRVARRVRDETRGDQQPELLVRLVDEVYLNPVQDVPAPQIAATPAAPTAAEPAGEPAPAEPTVVASIEPSDDAPGGGNGPARTGDQLYFGERVIHPPTWLDGVTIPAPTGWRSAAPVELVERDDNNSYGTAEPVPLAANIAARQFPRGDYDWFTVDVPTGGEIIVEAPEVADEIDLFARVWNAHHRVVADWQGAPRPGGALFARLPVPTPGRYWIEMTDGNRDNESTDAYTALIDFAPADDPFEPNNSFGTARPIPSTATFDATIFPRGDIDWYKVWVREPGLLSATITRVPDELDVYVRVWNLNGKVVTDWVGPPRKGGDTVMDSPLAQPGTYLIEVSDGNRDAATVEPFSIAFDFYPVTDVAEPNNAFGSPALVEPTSTHHPAIFPRGDIDWLAVDVPHPGELTMEITNSPKDLDLYMRVWTADKSVLRDWFGPGRKGGDVYGFADLPAPGRYFIEISDGNRDAASEDLFRLDLTYIAQPDQYEPNNGQADAAPLTPGRTVLFNILPRGDTDWFRIEVDSAGELAVLIDESPKDLDLHFRVWDANRKVVRDWVAPYRKGGVAEGFADLPRAGTYYLEVTDGNRDERSIEHATLTTTFTPVADPHEPNNGFGQLAPLALGTPIHTNLLPRGDADWYRLEAPRAGTFHVTIDEVDEDLDVYVRLWNSEVKAGSWFGPPRAGGVTEAELQVPAAGIYRLEVVDGNNDARSKVPFRLNVDFR
ncbi:MAG: caspase family protein [Alphaproteobacteria bacterium]